jgi:glycosyltransferase involved in cell wall biosynthesis
MPFKKRFDPNTNTIHIISLSCNAVPPVRYGGIELVIAHLCEGLIHLGTKVVCYSPGMLEIAGVRHFQTLAEPSLHIKEGGAPNTRQHLERVEEGLKSLAKPGDVILFNHPDHYRFLKRRLGIRFRLQRHIAEVAHWIDAGVQKNVIYPSAALKNQIDRPGVVIPHGEKLIFNPLPGAPRENFMFFAGRITLDKGVNIALDACKKLGIRLLLAGPLNDKAFAEQILSDPTVSYLGELTYPELFEYYAKAKALLYMTQYTEPFGLSVIEAMAAGCPVITTGKGGTGETVVEKVTGFFCQTAEDIARVYPQLESINPQDCIARGRDYSIEKMARHYSAYFQAM